MMMMPEFFSTPEPPLEPPPQREDDVVPPGDSVLKQECLHCRAAFPITSSTCPYCGREAEG